VLSLEDSLTFFSDPRLILFFHRNKSVAQSEKRHVFSLFRRTLECSGSNAFDMPVETISATYWFLSIALFQDSTSFGCVVSQLWFRRYAVVFMLRHGSTKDVICLLINFSKTFSTVGSTS